MKILEIELYSSDLRSTEIFYAEKLGLPVISRDQNCISFQAGDSTITFKHDPVKKPVYHFAFNIPDNKLDEALSWTKQRADMIKTPDNKEIVDFDNWNAKSFYFFDNNGNILEFLVRYDLNNYSKETFTHRSISNVSEMAIVTDDVNELAARLNSETGIPYFAKQPPHDNFTVMGNDEGLLIVSLADRHWYPTEIECKKFPVSISFSDEGRIHKLSFNKP